MPIPTFATPTTPPGTPGGLPPPIGTVLPVPPATPGTGGITELQWIQIWSGGGTYDPISVVPRQTLSGTAPSVAEQQVACAALNEAIGFGYGRFRIGLRILQPVVRGASPNPQTLLIPGVIGLGTIDAVESIQMDNATLPAGTGQTVYDGSQVVEDNTLSVAWALRGVTYDDIMTGTAYVVLELPAGPGVNLGNITATVRGLKVYDPRRDPTSPSYVPTSPPGAHDLDDPTTWEWSQNPVLALAHFLSTTDVGPEETLDWDTVADCADIADALVSGNPRRTIGIFFDKPREVDAIEDTLRSYAGVFLDRSGSAVRFVPDWTSAVEYAFTNAATANYLLDSLEIGRRSRRNAPTVVTVRYTDTSQVPWATVETEPVYAAGVLAGTTPWAESVIDWPGCQDAAMAYREAIRRINEYELDVTASLIATDDALPVTLGTVVSLTDVEGLAAAEFRVAAIEPNGPGRWSVRLTQYDADMYSSAVATGGGIDDPGYGSPFSPPTLSGLELYEDFVVGGSRIRVLWADPAWAYADGVRVLVWDGTALLYSGTAPRGARELYTTPLRIGVPYTVEIAQLSSTGALGATTSDTITLLGSDIEYRLVYEFWNTTSHNPQYKVSFAYGVTTTNQTDAIGIKFSNLPVDSAVLVTDILNMLDTGGVTMPVRGLIRVTAATDATRWLQAEWTSSSIVTDLGNDIIIVAIDNATITSSGANPLVSGEDTVVQVWKPSSVSQGFRSKSATSATLASYGNITLTVDAGLDYYPGQPVRALALGTDSWMEGTVVSYDTDQLTVSMGNSSGSGTYSDWVINAVRDTPPGSSGGGITALTGDVTASGSGSVAATIAANVVTYAKMQNVSATDRLLGRDTDGAGDPEELTVGGGIEFTGSGGIQRSALTGDVTATAGSGTTAIAADAVTRTKLDTYGRSAVDLFLATHFGAL